MHIVNRSSRAVTYELRGGPLRMTLSTCDLEPGDEETWRARYRGDIVTCTVIVTCDDLDQTVEAPADATVTVVDADGGVQIVVEA